MANFKDHIGREWTVSVDAQSAGRVRAECDERFLMRDESGKNTCIRLSRDPVLLCRVIYLLCEKQRESRDVAEGHFYMEVLRHSIEDATEALVAALGEFSGQASRQVIAHENKAR